MHAQRHAGHASQDSESPKGSARQVKRQVYGQPAAAAISGVYSAMSGTRRAFKG